MSDELLVKLFVVALVIYGTSLHEMAHAYVATWCGDPTPGRYGRLTWNPIPHLDPLSTAVVMPLVFYMMSGSLLGMAQTPIDPSRFRRPLRDHALVAVAGPIANFLLMALLLGILWIPGIYAITPDGTPANYLTAILPEAALWNLILGLFNLLPLPPLDGYRIARAFVPVNIRRQLDAFAAQGAMSMMVVLVVGSLILRQFAGPIYQLFNALLPTLTVKFI